LSSSDEKEKTEKAEEGSTSQVYENIPVLCHEDLNPSNYLVNEQTLEITAVLDWEWAGCLSICSDFQAISGDFVEEFNQEEKNDKNEQVELSGVERHQEKADNVEEEENNSSTDDALREQLEKEMQAVVKDEWLRCCEENAEARKSNSQLVDLSKLPLLPTDRMQMFRKVSGSAFDALVCTPTWFLKCMEKKQISFDELVRQHCDDMMADLEESLTEYGLLSSSPSA